MNNYKTEAVITSVGSTSTINGSLTYTSTNSGYFTNGAMNISVISSHNNKKSYIILGEEVYFDGYIDLATATALSTLNLLGKPFYDDMRKNGYKFCNEIEEYLRVKFLDQKIGKVLEENF